MHTSFHKKQDPRELFTLNDGSFITGTLVWYSAICEREVWLMSKNITPDSEDQSLDIGRAIHETSYHNEGKEVELEGVKFDIVKEKEHVVCEIKTTSKFIDSARLQLLYYLYRLKAEGYEFSGQILVPKERKTIKVQLDQHGEQLLKETFAKIKEITKLDRPPKPKFIPFCRRCAYRYFCWSE